MEIYFKYVIITSAFISFISLLYLLSKTFSFGKKSFYSTPRGSKVKGILYAFGKGTLPWEKESVKNHFLSYIAGIFYYLGIFSGLFYLLIIIFNFNFSYSLIIIRIFLIMGIVCGIGLFSKRFFLPELRILSCADDFFSNFLVNIFLCFTLLDTITKNIRIFYYIITIILFLYIPLGKIRHCFFFFWSRAVFGIFFGRRGVLPRKNFE